MMKKVQYVIYRIVNDDGAKENFFWSGPYADINEPCEFVSRWNMTNLQWEVREKENE